MPQIQKIAPFLTINGRAEEAAQYYADIFDGRILRTTRWPDGVPGPAGDVLVVELELLGVTFHLLNSGPTQPFSPALSLLIACDDQAEVDRYWAAFSDGGKPNACGWIEDRFGVSWQVTPKHLLTYISDPDTKKAAAAMAAMMTMQKLDVAALRRAHDGA
jgi:predicted 3-demethylubiquinone-9 3-methyltransferase (glyoxalase superfamily)